MHWLSFLIGALVGWLVCWLIDYLICRPRRMADQALLTTRLEQGTEDSASLRAQISGCQDLQVRLDGANAEIGTLKAQVAGMKDLQARLDGASSQAAELQAQLARMKGVQADLDACRAQATQQGLEIERLNAELAAGVSAAAAGAAAAADAAVGAGTLEARVDASALRTPEMGIALTSPVARPGRPDDLDRIAGIGPQINALLNLNGLYTFRQLAATSVDQVRSILSSGGSRFNLADPQTWPEQALLARDGKWDALKAFQDTLKGGRAA
jgi:predicted flap endonuclease-1-like 5' DNA nuclease